MGISLEGSTSIKNWRATRKIFGKQFNTVTESIKFFVATIWWLNPWVSVVASLFAVNEAGWGCIIWLRPVGFFAVPARKISARGVLLCSDWGDFLGSGWFRWSFPLPIWKMRPKLWRPCNLDTQDENIPKFRGFNRRYFRWVRGRGAIDDLGTEN